jgi:hypothetical protein
MTAADLFSALGSVPRLELALCKGRSDVFDADTDEHAAQAIELCQRCPERRKCAAWADSQPPNSLDGIVAGHRYTWTQQAMRRPRKAAS